MKIFEAKKWVKTQRFIAVLIMGTAAIFFICSALKSISFSMVGDLTALSPLSQGVQRGVYFIYQHTQFLGNFWRWAPVFTPKALNTSGNFGFILIIIAGAIGRIMWDSAANLSIRIAKTIAKVEEIGWEQELMRQNGHIQSGKADILQINIDLNQEDQWYKRPLGLILLGVAVAILGQLANLYFGFVKL